MHLEFSLKKTGNRSKMDRLKKMLVPRTSSLRKASSSLSHLSGPPPYSSMDPVPIFDNSLIMPSAPSTELMASKQVAVWVEATLKIRTDRPLQKCADAGAMVARMVDKYGDAVGYKPAMIATLATLVVLIEAVSEDPGMFIYKATFSHPVLFRFNSPYTYGKDNVEMKKAYKSSIKGITAYVEVNISMTPTEIKTTEFEEVINMAHAGAAQSSTTVHSLLDMMGMKYNVSPHFELICD